MKLKEFDIALDIKKHIDNEYIEIVEDDLNTNVLNISIMDDLEFYNLGSATLEIVFLKENGDIITQTDYEIVDNRIRLILSDEVVAGNGLVLSEIRILGDNVILTTSRFEMVIRESIYKAVI